VVRFVHIGNLITLDSLTVYVNQHKLLIILMALGSHLISVIDSVALFSQSCS